MNDRRRGQALVEFVLVAPIFFLILFAMIDFGRYVYYVQTINNAAREGARYAIVHGSDSLAPSGPGDDAAVKSAVRRYLIGVVGDGSTPTITPSWDPNNRRESLVTVNVRYQFHSVIPIVPIPPIQIDGASTLVINN
jgi:Flp pilus assembly protein TadG